MAKLVEPTTEVHGLNPVFGKNDIEQCLLSTVLKRRKIKNTDAGNGPFKKELHKKQKYILFILAIAIQATQLT